MTEKIIIDTDPGVDDALAILLLLARRGKDVLAVTTVAGNTTIQNTTNNARCILDLAGAEIPIYSGAKKPLEEDLVTANVHGWSGMAGVDIVKQEPLNGLAVDKIIEIVRQNPSEVNLVVIGPQTNIALALKKEPEIAKMIKRIVMMGGAVSVPGNKNRVAEFNVFVDPDAAKVVFDSGIPITMIPLDVCNVTPLFMEDFEKLRGTKYGQFVLSIMDKYIKAIAKFEGRQGALVYDALATYYLINPEAFETQEMDVRVETKGEYTRGMTVADQRTWGEKQENVTVVTKLDREKFKKDFIEYLTESTI